MHYKTRDKIISSMALWSIVLMQAKIRRYFADANDYYAEKWLNKAQERNDLFYISMEAILEENFIVKSFIKLISRDKINVKCSLFTKGKLNPIEVEKEIASCQFKIYPKILVEKLYKLSLKMNKNEELNYYIKYLYFRHISYNPLEMHIYLSKYIASTKEKDLFLETYNSLKLEHNIFDLIQSPKSLKSRPNHLVLIASNYISATEAIMNLPHDKDLKIYVLNMEGNESYKGNLPHSNLKFSIESLQQSLYPIFSNIDINSVKYAEKISEMTSNSIEKHLQIFSSFNYKLFIEDGIKLHLHDIILNDVKLVMAIDYLTKTYSDMYFSLSSDRISTKVINIINQLDISKNKIFSLNNKTNPIINNDIIRKDNIDYNMDEVRKSYSRFSKDKLNKNYDVKEFDKRYIISTLNVIDQNYKKLSDIVIDNIEQEYDILFLCNNPEHPKTKKFLKDIADKYQNRIEMVSLNQRDLTLNSEKKLWLNNLIYQVNRDLSQQGKLRIDSMDFQSIIEPHLKNLIGNFLPWAINHTSQLTNLILSKKPELFLTMPGRNSGTWVTTDICKELDVKTIELQAVFQSNHPKYKRSKANIFAMINDEQINLYKSNYELEEDQSIIKIGPLLLSNALLNLKNIDLNELKLKLNINKNEKTILFATQYLNHEHCQKILEMIINLCQDKQNIKIILKPHPKETEQEVAKYLKIIEELNATEMASIIKKINTHELIMASDLVITLFSNVGMEAALIGRDAWSVNLENTEFPIDLSAEGLAKKINGAEEFKTAVEDFFNKRTISKELLINRENYIKDNSEVLDENILKKLIFNFESEFK